MNLEFLMYQREKARGNNEKIRMEITLLDVVGSQTKIS